MCIGSAPVPLLLGSTFFKRLEAFWRSVTEITPAIIPSGALEPDACSVAVPISDVEPDLAAVTVGLEVSTLLSCFIPEAKAEALIAPSPPPPP